MLDLGVVSACVRLLGRTPHVRPLNERTNAHGRAAPLASSQAIHLLRLQHDTILNCSEDCSSTMCGVYEGALGHTWCITRAFKYNIVHARAF